MISSDIQSLGQTLLDKATMADQMIDDYFDGKRVYLERYIKCSTPDYKQSRIDKVEAKRASSKA